MKALLIFNKFTKEYIGSTSGRASDRNNIHFLYREETINLETQAWEGDYDSGEIKPISQLKSIISEAELDQDCQDKIFRRYKYHHQLNAIYEVLDKLISAIGADNPATNGLAEFNEMQEYLSSIRQNNARFKTAYDLDPAYSYLDKQAERDLVNRQMEGGLHEIIGRPEREADLN